MIATTTHKWLPQPRINSHIHARGQSKFVDKRINIPVSDESRFLKGEKTKNFPQPLLIADVLPVRLSCCLGNRIEHTLKYAAFVLVSGWKLLKLLFKGLLVFVCVSSANNRLYLDPYAKPAQAVNNAAFYGSKRTFYPAWPSTLLQHNVSYPGGKTPIKKPPCEKKPENAAAISNVRSPPVQG